MSDPPGSIVSPEVDTLALALHATTPRRLRQAAPVAEVAVDPTEVAVRAALTRGDPREALTLLMDRHGDGVHHFCRRLVGDERAVDVHQQVFIDAFRGLPGFDGRSTAATWLFAIARRRCIDAARERSRRRSREDREADAVEQVADPRPSADVGIDDARRYAAVTACIDELAPAARAAVLLRYQEGMRYEQLASVLGESANTIGRRVARALVALRECVEGKLGGTR